MSIQPELPRAERSQLVRERLHAAVESDRRNRIEMGEMFSALEEQKYWRDWGFPSFWSCVLQEYGLGRSTTRELIKVYRKLVVLGLTPAEMRELEWSKAVLVTRVLTPENAADILRDVKDLHYRELKKKYHAAKAPTAAPSPPSPPAAPPVAAAPPGDWRRPKPPEDEFYVGDSEWEQLCFAQHHSEPALLKGHSGGGKTELCALLAHAYGKQLERFNLGAMTEARSSLIGNTHFNPARGTWFQPSRFVAAVQDPRACVLLDELSRAPRDAFNLLLPALDGQRYLALDESADGALVSVAEGVSFLATANLGAAYTGADQLDLALLDRFPVVLEMGFPPPGQEAAILVKRCPGLGAGDAQHLVRFAGRQREMASEGEFTAFVSTRTLLAAGRRVAAGVALANAIRFCVVYRFAADGGDASEQTRLLQIIQKLLG